MNHDRLPTPRLRLISLAAGLLCFTSLSSSAPSAIEFPEGYRNWKHIKSQVIQEGPGFDRFGGLHHIYANDLAIQGARSGVFEDGAVIVADFQTLKKRNNVLDGGERRFINVMVRNNSRFAATGGWGYAEFLGDSRSPRPLEAETECFGCHTQRRAEGFVFTKLH